MKENYTVCNCMKVSYGDIEDALHKHSSFSDVLEAFNSVQMITHCSTGCGGCHQKVLDIISELMMAPSAE
ncbi:MAG: (2Fe-2S)-binding protein [Clostridia bacterium]|nr:(2Fe-2S)-binding protein [Clostridia bacterium]MBQ9847804.1 (2Fe-2S)-binding protein [Clostridia bacterium]